MASLPLQYRWGASDIAREIDDAFATLIEAPWGRHPGHGLTGWPAIDLYDVGGAYLLLVDLPGVDSADVELKVEEREVVFCGIRWSTGFVRHGRRLITERSCGRFCRRFTFDEPVDVNEVEQGHENGIFWARLPKQHRPTRKE